MQEQEKQNKGFQKIENLLCQSSFWCFVPPLIENPKTGQKQGLCITFRIYISKIICTPTSLKESTCHPVLLFAWQCHKRFCFFKPPKLNLHFFFLLCARIGTTKDLINWNQMPIKCLKIWTNFKFLFHFWQINCCEPSERNCKKVHESLPVISPAESTREQFSTANWLLLFLKQKQKLNFFPSYHFAQWSTIYFEAAMKI